jgi:5-oxoprolinase (ATP-hydrolysing)
VIARNAGKMKPGDVYVLNDPVPRGTAPAGRVRGDAVYLDEGAPRLAVLSTSAPAGHHSRHRRHHARLDAAVLDPDRGMRACRSTMSSCARAGRSSKRRCARCCRAARIRRAIPEQNLADLKAQVAANEKGVRELRAMVAQYGLEVVQSYMRHVQDNAEDRCGA